MASLKLLLATMTILLGACRFDEPVKPAPAEVALTDATYTQVEEALAGYRGKVVIVDIWSIYCIPCKKKMPHLVELYESKKKDGLAVITLTPDDKEDRAKVQAFLQEKKATMKNLFLVKDPKPTKAQDEQFPTDFQPTVLVFNREGKRVKLFDGEMKEKELDDLVAKLLKN